MADRKIAVLQVVNGFGMGGIERQQTEIIKRLPADRFTQIIATMRLSGPFYPEVKATGVEVVEFPFNSLRNKQAVAHYFGLARLIRQRRVHLVYCYDFYTNIWGAISVTLAGRGKLITSRGDTGRMFSKAQLAVQRMAYACASAIVPNSDLVKDIIIEKEFVPTWKIRRIYNGIDAERFAPRAASPELARSLGLPPGATVIGAVGNLHPWKGQDTLLRAAARIREVRPDAWFLLIG
ncbi:MAG TPA: glycosyltransferase, partial [Planctomycetota bacterium]|nr:glycosyltransferase [Planctomycetota bacterium]